MVLSSKGELITFETTFQSTLSTSLPYEHMYSYLQWSSLQMDILRTFSTHFLVARVTCCNHQIIAGYNPGYKATLVSNAKLGS